MYAERRPLPSRRRCDSIKVPKVGLRGVRILTPLFAGKGRREAPLSGFRERAPASDLAVRSWAQQPLLGIVRCAVQES